MYTLVVYQRKRRATIVAYIRGVPISHRISSSLLKLEKPRKVWMSGKAASYKVSIETVLSLIPPHLFRRFCTDGRRRLIDEFMKEAYRRGLVEIKAEGRTVELWLREGIGATAERIADVDTRCFGRREGVWYLVTPPWCCGEL